VNSANPSVRPASPSEDFDGLTAMENPTRQVSDAVLEDLAADSALWPVVDGFGIIAVPRLPRERAVGDPARGKPLTQSGRPQTPAEFAAGVAFLGMAAGICLRGTGAADARKRRSGGLFPRWKLTSGRASACW
jgi:hypothetical protein